MASKRLEKHIRCPFYISEKDLQIRCEGLYKDSKNDILFKNLREKKGHMGNYCQGDYENCKLCQVLDKKYNGKGEVQ